MQSGGSSPRRHTDRHTCAVDGPTRRPLSDLNAVSETQTSAADFFPPHMHHLCNYKLLQQTARPWYA